MVESSYHGLNETTEHVKQTNWQGKRRGTSEMIRVINNNNTFYR